MSDLCKCGHARTEHAYVIEDGPCGAQPDGCQKYAPADRDDLAAILSEHYPIRDEGTEQVVCWCLWKPETRLYGFAEWDAVRAHVAQMVLESDWLCGVKADVWDEGRASKSRWAVCPDCLGAGCVACKPANPYRADRVDAEDGGR